jgi:hypothetical protein
MSRLVVSTAMTVDGVISVGEWYVSKTDTTAPVAISSRSDCSSSGRRYSTRALRFCATSRRARNPVDHSLLPGGGTPSRSQCMFSEISRSGSDPR